MDDSNDDAELLDPVPLRQNSAATDLIESRYNDEERSPEKAVADGESTISLAAVEENIFVLQQANSEQANSFQGILVDSVQENSVSDISEGAISANPNTDSDIVIEGIIEMMKSKL